MRPARLRACALALRKARLRAVWPARQGAGGARRAAAPRYGALPLPLHAPAREPAGRGNAGQLLLKRVHKGKGVLGR